MRQNWLASFLRNLFNSYLLIHVLWWPHTVGPQNLYDLNLSFEVSGKPSDTKKVRFGMREISSWMNEFDKKHTKVFQVNGKNIVIRGGGYVQDLMLRPDNDRIDADLLYAKHMNLNALRMEAPRGSDYLFERCDEEGILLMVGWCCLQFMGTLEELDTAYRRHSRAELERPDTPFTKSPLSFHMVIR